MPSGKISAALLQDMADATRHAAKQTQLHIDAEIQGLAPELMETLTPEGPYAYTIIPKVRPDGSVCLPVLTTAEEIRAAYEMVWHALAAQRVRFERSPRRMVHVSGQHIPHAAYGKRAARRIPNDCVLPVGKRQRHHQRTRLDSSATRLLGAPLKAPDEVRIDMLVREEVFLPHAQYVDALDADAVVATLNAGVASAIRDYVSDMGPLITLEGDDAYRAHYEAFFRKYEIVSVEAWERIAEECYVFAELRITASRRADGVMVAFNTAAFFVPANDGKFIARIGHGTDPIPTKAVR
jgi:hypothetical protein